MNTEDLLQRLDLEEDQDVEFKLAEGGLPKSLWDTISVFANRYTPRALIQPMSDCVASHAGGLVPC